MTGINNKNIYIYISELITDRYKYIPEAYLTAVCDVTLIKLIVARYVGTGCF